MLKFIFYLFSKNKRPKSPFTTSLQLTKQEQRILELLLTDQTNKNIAETFFISVSTVKTHVNNIYKKLKINSRHELKKL